MPNLENDDTTACGGNPGVGDRFVTLENCRTLCDANQCCTAFAFNHPDPSPDTSAQCWFKVLPDSDARPFTSTVWTCGNPHNSYHFYTCRHLGAGPPPSPPPPSAPSVDMEVGYRVYGTSEFDQYRSPFGATLPDTATRESYCTAFSASATTTVQSDNEGWTCTVPQTYTQTSTKLGNGRCCHPDQGAECSPTTGPSLYRGNELTDSIQSLDEISGVSGTPGNGAACRAECEAR